MDEDEAPKRRCAGCGSEVPPFGSREILEWTAASLEAEATVICVDCMVWAERVGVERPGS